MINCVSFYFLPGPCVCLQNVETPNAIYLSANVIWNTGRFQFNPVCFIITVFLCPFRCFFNNKNQWVKHYFGNWDISCIWNPYRVFLKHFPIVLTYVFKHSCVYVWVKILHVMGLHVCVSVFLWSENRKFQHWMTSSTGVMR